MEDAFCGILESGADECAYFGRVPGEVSKTVAECIEESGIYQISIGVS